MTKDEAENIVIYFILKDKLDCVLLSDATEEFTKCFVIYYQSSKYIETGKDEEMYVGHGGVIVSKENGDVFETGTAFAVEHYVDVFDMCGDPFAVPTGEVEVNGWLAGAKKVSAIKHIKALSGLGLKQSKNVIDRALEYQPTTFNAGTPANAEKTVRILSKYRFNCRQLWSNQCK
ncbi:MAG: ribosomal protein L7/L12 [Alteromonadaceae bacterium]|nr:ribosomal protein L7/L12 [Alteromonadaceae bacterium]